MLQASLRVARPISARASVVRTTMAARSPREGAVVTETLQVLPSQYPDVRRDATVVEEIHGVKVADPYRWLEDPDADETKAFVDAQNRVTDALLEQCETRGPFRDLMTKLYDYPKRGVPHREGQRYFAMYNSGLQNQYVLQVRSTLDGEPSTVLDPNTLSTDGTVALTAHSVARDGEHVAYFLASGGSDWCEAKFLRVRPDGVAKALLDAGTLRYVKFSSLEWTHDCLGIFYNRYLGPKGLKELGTERDINENQQLCYHRLGRPQEDDPVVWADPAHPRWMCGAEVTEDGKYLVLYISEGCLPANRLYVVDLEQVPRAPDGSLDFSAHDVAKGRPMVPLTKLVDSFDGSYSYVCNDGPVFTFRTNCGAPRYKLVRCDVRDAGDPRDWATVVPQHDKDVLKWAHVQHDTLLTCYMVDVKDELQVRRLSDGALLQTVDLPGIGTLSGLSGKRSHDDFFVNFTSFTDPGSIYRGSIGDGGARVDLELVQRSEVPGFDPEDFETRQEFVTSRDGTRVPMFIIHRRGRPVDGSALTLLYGYGGFNVSILPTFSVSRIAFLRAYDGVAAVANLRGGGEYGVSWRDAGSVMNKQNVFDDFQSCAEHLIERGYTSRGRVVIEGGSNGGLLVAACCNQRPDLFGCAIAKVGVMDMLRFHLHTIGHAWKTGYGCADDPEQFAYLLGYSPLHNVRVPELGTRNYPPMLLTTADHDDRVVPSHSLKLIAELQHTLCGSPDSPQRNPLVVRVEVRAGHGAGKPTAKVIEEIADCYGFAAKVTGTAWAA